jgi:hypothetical protein
MIPRRLLLLAPLVLAAGCDTAPRAYTDPTSGLVDVPGGDAPLDKPVQVEPPVALVASAGSKKLLRAPAPPAAAASGTAPGVRVAAATAVDPQYFVATAVGVLKRRWPDLALVDDLPAAREGKFKTTLVLDLRAYRPTTESDTNRADITLVVMDATQKPLSRILAQGTGNAFDARLRDAIDAAAEQLQQKIDKLLH